MLNTEAIRPDVAPKDGNFVFNIPELQAMLPDGTLDAVEPVYKELPEWKESPEDARARYKQIITELANRYPLENLLLVAHGEGVGTSVSAFSVDKTVYEVEYCAYSGLRRHIVYGGQSFKAGDFQVFSQSGIATISDAP
uniref:Phosphoglycerate mutase family protein n=1 Tax=Rhizophora mucronata TaxID=61149 RepID=A0A2P2P2C5_RHIMU